MKQLTYFALHFVIALGICWAANAVAEWHEQPYTPWLIVLQITLVCIFVSLVELEKWLKGELEHIFSPRSTDPSSLVKNALDLSPIEFPDHPHEHLAKLLAWMIVPTLLCLWLKVRFDPWSAPTFFVTCAGVFTVYQFCFVAYEVRRTWRTLKHANSKVAP
jgi:FtsH-binding integral membrane protein